MFLAPLVTATGYALAVGGGSTSPAIVEKFIGLIGGPEASILVLPQTHQNQDGAASVAMLKKHGAKNVQQFSVENYTLANKREAAKLILNAKGIWIPGGNQNLVTQRFGVDWVQKTFSEAFRRGVSFFGTSAGAALMSDPMLAGTNEDGSPKIARGSGLVPFLIDTHYRTRNRQARMRTSFELAPYPQAVGLNEGEWILVKNGEIIEVGGSPDFLKR